jgi:endonuclease YncB( thermonuclease family)
LNKTVDIKRYGLYQYNPILGVIFLDHKNIDLEMVKAGLAEVNHEKPQRCFDTFQCHKAEAEAQGAKKGKWNLGRK